MQVKDVSTKEVQYVDPDTTITDVAKRMKDCDCGMILIGEGDHLTGVVTDRDITVRCVAEGEDPDEVTADQCKTPKVLYCYENEDVEDVLRNMAQNKVRRLVVLDNEQNKNLAGIVSFGDLSAACEHKEVSGEAMGEIRQAA